MITNEVKVSFQKTQPIKPMTLASAEYMTWYVVEHAHGETYLAIKTYNPDGSSPAFLFITEEGRHYWSSSDGSNYKVLNESAKLTIQVNAQ